MEVSLSSDILRRIEGMLHLAAQTEISIDHENLNLLLQGLGLIEMEICTVEEGGAGEWDVNDFLQMMDAAVPALDAYLKTDQQTLIEVEQTNRAVAVQETSLTLVKPDFPAQKTEESPLQQQPSTPTPREAQVLEETIRVGVSQLDSLANVAGEMIINQISTESYHQRFREIVNTTKAQARRWSQIQTTLENVKNEVDSLLTVDQLKHQSATLGHNMDDLRKLMDEYNAVHVAVADESADLSNEVGENITQNNAIVTQLQETVKEMRMLPVSTVFDFFPRAVRDLARQFNKEIQLTIEGGETRLDKHMIDQLKAPLLHLVRNSADHGLESPEEREKKGKPRQGELVLSAHQEGDEVIIQIIDDGRGIHPAKVRQKALEKGVIDENRAEAISNREAVYLIFEPGFSTKSVVTDTSGRGVGMDVVRQEIEALKGKVLIETEIDRGTQISLILPLTLAISQMCLVEAEDSFYAIPTSAILTTAVVPVSHVRSMVNQSAIMILDQITPLVYLSDVLGFGRSQAEANDEIPVVVIEHEHQRMAFAVNRFLGVHVMVIKSVGDHLKRVENVAGTSILGSGEVAIILHIPDLMKNAKSVAQGRKKRAKMLPAVEEKKRQAILVVEDSMITRELEKNILESAGYEVDVAVDGQEGLEKISQKDYQLVVSDVDMPHLNGFEFIKQLKADERYKHIKAVVVTSLAKGEEKQQSDEAGVDAYIVKSAFDQGRLIATVKRLIG